MGIITGDDITVLVADDSHHIRELLCTMLRMRGVDVVEAEDGRRVVELPHRVRPNLVLMALSMPVLDGYEATRQLRGGAGTCRIPVVAMSAFCDSQNRQRAIEAGCVDCVGKPLDFGLIEKTLRTHLQIH